MVSEDGGGGGSVTGPVLMPAVGGKGERVLVGVLLGVGKGGERKVERVKGRDGEGEGGKSGPALWDAGFRAIVALLWEFSDPKRGWVIGRFQMFIC